MSAKAGWTRVAFGDVVRKVSDRVDPEDSGLERYVAGEHMDTDDLRIRRWGTIGDGYLGPAFHMRFKPGHVLYGSRRTYLRKVAVADFEGITANTTFVLESKDPRALLPELLPFVMQTEAFHEHAIKQSKGSVNPYINFSDLTWFEFPLPPIDEQRRIASALSAIESTDEAYRHLASTGERAMEALIAQELSAWQSMARSTQLQEHAQVQYGLTLGPSRRGAAETIPYLRVANVLRGRIDLSEVKCAGRLPGDDSYRLHPGDLLVVEGHANVDEIGRAAVWRSNDGDVFHQNHLIRIRCSDTLDSEYLALAINSGPGRGYFRAQAKNTSGLNTINSTVVKQFPLSVPPIAMQRAIVDTAMLVGSGVDEARGRRAGVHTLKRSLLEQVGRA
ncbi:MAG: restriction endonuclease subunit S [Acidobacteria bacterium]|nr:restriction endonuclease subunit S [Acidobacteriota bacterium]